MLFSATSSSKNNLVSILYPSHENNSAEMDSLYVTGVTKLYSYQRGHYLLVLQNINYDDGHLAGKKVHIQNEKQACKVSSSYFIN